MLFLLYIPYVKFWNEQDNTGALAGCDTDFSKPQSLCWLTFSVWDGSAARLKICQIAQIRVATCKSSGVVLLLSKVDVRYVAIFCLCCSMRRPIEHQKTQQTFMSQPHRFQFLYEFSLFTFCFSSVWKNEKVAKYMYFRPSTVISRSKKHRDIGTTYGKKIRENATEKSLQ